MVVFKITEQHIVAAEGKAKLRGGLCWKLKVCLVAKEMRNGSFRAVATFSALSKFLQHHIAREARTSSHRGVQAEGWGLEPDIEVSLIFEDSMSVLLSKVTRSWFWQQQWLAKLYRRQNRLQSWRKDTYIRFGILKYEVSNSYLWGIKNIYEVSQTYLRYQNNPDEVYWIIPSHQRPKTSLTWLIWEIMTF